MSDKQALLQAVGSLPEGATWAEITDTLLDLAARRGATADFAKLYRTQLTPDQIADYQNPKAEYRLDDVIAELETREPA